MSLLDYLTSYLDITDGLTNYQLGFYDLFANRRPWSYFLTLTFRDGFQDVAAKTVSSKLSSWARDCQAHRERFEYVVFEERGSPDSPPHLHGLLYLEPSYELGLKLRTLSRFGGPKTLDGYLEANWAPGLAKVQPVSDARGGVGGALAYSLKDFNEHARWWASRSL